MHPERQPPRRLGQHGGRRLWAFWGPSGGQCGRIAGALLTDSRAGSLVSGLVKDIPAGVLRRLLDTFVVRPPAPSLGLCAVYGELCNRGQIPEVRRCWQGGRAVAILRRTPRKRGPPKKPTVLRIGGCNYAPMCHMRFHGI